MNGNFHTQKLPLTWCGPCMWPVCPSFYPLPTVSQCILMTEYSSWIEWQSLSTNNWIVFLYGVLNFKEFKYGINTIHLSLLKLVLSAFYRCSSKLLWSGKKWKSMKGVLLCYGTKEFHNTNLTKGTQKI